jgi:hypothetical protein
MVVVSKQALEGFSEFYSMYPETLRNSRHFTNIAWIAGNCSMERAAIMCALGEQLKLGFFKKKQYQQNSESYLQERIWEVASSEYYKPVVQFKLDTLCLRCGSKKNNTDRFCSVCTIALEASCITVEDIRQARRMLKAV